ncbi:MAG: signal protein [Terriglobia bacterium]
MPASVPTAPAAAPAPQAPKPASPAVAPTAKTAPSASTAYTPPPTAGMVWVNLDTKVYHKEGDRWYGKTKNGKYMTEADAIKAGYRPVKEKEKKQQ